MNSIGNLSDKKTLLLQGPMGLFFKRLDTLFRAMGATTYRIGFNAGDCIFAHRDNYLAYRGKREEWPLFIKNYLKTENIDQIYLFGDCRYYQSHAIRVARKLGLEVFVFEEGYIRPNYITLEKFGVNDYSHISRSKTFYEALAYDSLEVPETVSPNSSQFEKITSAIVYYSLSNLLHFRYPNYQHHRDFSAISEAFYGIRNITRKFYYQYIEKDFEDKIRLEMSKQYYFVPLQTHNDFQILQHSGYRSIEKFIIEVLESFAEHAPKDTKLIFKHHPVDRGRKNYRDFIFEQSDLLEITDRVVVLFDVHLPTCLKHAIGTVTINSTVGLSSIYHGTPTITLGNAIYDIEGLTCKDCNLAEFWTNPSQPDAELYKKYEKYIIKNTQLNGSFYGMLPVLNS